MDTDKERADMICRIYQRLHPDRYPDGQKTRQQLAQLARERAAIPRYIVVRKGEGLIQIPGRPEIDELHIRVIDTAYMIPAGSPIKRKLGEAERVMRYKTVRELKKIRRELRRMRQEAGRWWDGLPTTVQEALLEMEWRQRLALAHLKEMHALAMEQAKAVGK